MSRKYLNRDEKKSEPADAFEKTDKEFFLQKDPSANSTEAKFDSLGDDIRNLDQYIGSLSKHLVDQKARIEAMKKLQDNFEKEIGILNSGGQSIPIQVKKNEFEGLGGEFESEKIIGDITSIVEKQVQNRILVLESQLEEERKNSYEFRKILGENLKEFNRIEKNLKKEKTRLEDVIREKTQKLVQAERLSAIGELASRLAHDMRNPLSVIKATVQLIKHTNKDLDDTTRKRVDLIEGSIFRMAHQIDGVLDYVKATPLKKKPSSLNEIIMAAIQTLLIPPNVTINVPKAEITFLCDPQKIEIVVANMILNSIQAIGDQKGVINIRTKKHQDSLVIRIEDSGKGVPQSIMDKIFDPLFTTKEEGTGLGLASCKNIVEQHKGKISVSNDPTVFSITLPLY
ncbi:MAG TPA: ATP-binding protein [Candidatus Nitrosotenuis sp.]|nr:ATP-binding protein [Candidatus Nitrosotenuis sp.]